MLCSYINAIRNGEAKIKGTDEGQYMFLEKEKKKIRQANFII